MSTVTNDWFKDIIIRCLIQKYFLTVTKEHFKGL